jgi:hypothetical protein
MLFRSSNLRPTNSLNNAIICIELSYAVVCSGSAIIAVWVEMGFRCEQYIGTILSSESQICRQSGNTRDRQRPGHPRVTSRQQEIDSKRQVTLQEASLDYDQSATVTNRLTRMKNKRRPKHEVYLIER